jgi:dipeptidase D
MNRILKDLQPENVWVIFEEISRIPRCSKKEDQVQEYLESWASEKGISFKKDETGNVLLTREAIPGCEDYPTLLLQGHQDMVCEKDQDIYHNFERDSLPLRVEDGLISSEGTTLGADNGIGIALAMAILSDPTLEKHGRIEAVFTVDEESGFTGIRNMKADFFSGKRMINLDSEELGVIIISSAGGGSTEYTFPLKREDPTDSEALRVAVSGLLGGHSGVDIHLPNTNANILLAKGLWELNKLVPIRIIHIEGGTRGNAIPRSAYAEILVPKDQSSKAKKTIENWAIELNRSVEKDLAVKVSEFSPSEAVDLETSSKVINLISEIPQGVFSWSQEYEDLVQTSNNLGIVRTEEDEIKAPIFSRTSDSEDFKENQAKLRDLGEKYGVKTEQNTGGSGWKADPDSKFLTLVAKCYEETYGKKPKITGIHGGLECGVFTQLDPELEIVSIGPNIKNPHSPREYLEVDSVAVLWRILKNIVERINEEK